MSNRIAWENHQSVDWEDAGWLHCSDVKSHYHEPLPAGVVESIYADVFKGDFINWPSDTGSVTLAAGTDEAGNVGVWAVANTEYDPNDPLKETFVQGGSKFKSMPNHKAAIELALLMFSTPVDFNWVADWGEPAIAE